MKKCIFFFQLLNLALFFYPKAMIASEEAKERRRTFEKAYHIVTTFSKKNEKELEEILTDDTRGPNFTIDGVPLLNYTIMHAWPKGTSMVLKAGANPDFGGHRDVYPLLTAVEFGCFAITSHLLDNGASIHVSDSHGRTALHLAVDCRGSFPYRVCKRRKIAQMLLDAGVSTDVKDLDGKTPLDIAVLGEHQEMIDLIKMHTTEAPESASFNFNYVTKRFFEFFNLFSGSPVNEEV